MSKLTVVAKIVAKKDAVEKVQGELLKLIAPTRKEDGCISYNLFQDNDNSSAFVFFENWQSAAHLEAHMNTTHFQAFAKAIDGLTEEVAINKLTQVD